MLSRRSFLGNSVIVAAGGSLLAWLSRPRLVRRRRTRTKQTR